MPLPAMDKISGCLLIATWASSLLYMSEVYRTLYYFRHFEKDDWKLKTLVTVALVVDTVSTVGDYICVYLYTIIYVGMSQTYLPPLMANWMLAGDLEYLSNGHWPIPLYVFATGVLGGAGSRLSSHPILALYPKLAHFSCPVSRNNHRGMQITVSAHRFHANGIAAQFFSVVASSVVVALYPSIEDRLKVKIPAALWLVTEVTVDAGITSALLWEFRKASSILTETTGILDRLTAGTIQSGAAAATLAGAGLIASLIEHTGSRSRYYIVPESNVPEVFLFQLRRVYVITLLANLNVRKSGKSLSTTVTSSESGPTTASGEQRPLTLTSWNIDDSCGIHVHHTVHTVAHRDFAPNLYQGHILSSKITIYKGNGTTNILLAILKQYRFVLPAGLENIPADWEKVVEAVQDALTQRRSKIKKSIRGSLKPNKDGGYAPKEDHLNIFDLTQNIVKGTQCAVNVVLCARIALMRKVYRKHPGVKFWDELDKRLAKIRAEAKGDMKQVTRAFRHILTEDQDTHGAKTYELDENTVDTFQEGVDALIEAGAKDALGMRDDA
ncbi:hypothetical protein B0H14DRAFT_3612582 [Mycena olivaceomarginata]|nr:hypothetical protein B0H14DRAFT_3612582 [Mycena olivaceomarginata]